MPLDILDMCTLSNVKTRRGEQNPPCVGVTSDAFPEAENTKIGVSVEYAPDPEKRWFVFRASYGREDNAFDFLVGDGTYCYIAKRYVEKFVRGKRKRAPAFPRGAPRSAGEPRGKAGAAASSPSAA